MSKRSPVIAGALLAVAAGLAAQTAPPAPLERLRGEVRRIALSTQAS